MVQFHLAAVGHCSGRLTKENTGTQNSSTDLQRSRKLIHQWAIVTTSPPQTIRKPSAPSTSDWCLRLHPITTVTISHL
uniref:Uncharacterized protein n=1 Tax=Knipowitschia caucasica TaxID=637954 RepID=A0AAV2M085_KNICA